MAKRGSDAKPPPAEDVDEYLAAMPEEMRVALQNLRKTIQAAAPEATETISYRIPPSNTRDLSWRSRQPRTTARSIS